MKHKLSSYSFAVLTALAALMCAIATGQAAVVLDFHSGVDEIFDVQVLSNVRSPVVSGPFPALDGGQTIWVVPEPSAGDRDAPTRAP